ncbi:hypothetical protein PSTEL_04120 [Paenibacillus stellifer]|uniref:Uncharacterized protein n=1 Tax=Paenibacillus stellifer TaxID=169760 RepID=A0A089LNJ5_9BACL|nr:hypothetical protein PSTEL_04120 [Paenibacillus stellifer]
MELRYASRTRRGQIAYLQADVWYCRSWDKGYMLKAFESVTDAHNEVWNVQLMAAQKQKPVSTGTKPAQPMAKGAVVTGQSELRIDYIHSILPVESQKCPSCSVILHKRSVRLKIFNANHIDYIPCSVYECRSCSKRMLRKHHYNALVELHWPYRIDVLQPPKSPAKAWQQTRSKKPAVQTQGRSKGKRHTASGQPNKLFNQYGVFVPSPTGRTGYFDE